MSEVQEVGENEAIITVSAEEQVRTADYCHIKVGPIFVKTKVSFDDDDDLKFKTQGLQQLVEQVVAEERETAVNNLQS